MRETNRQVVVGIPKELETGSAPGQRHAEVLCSFLLHGTGAAYRKRQRSGAGRGGLILASMPGAGSHGACVREWGVAFSAAISRDQRPSPAQALCRAVSEEDKLTSPVIQACEPGAASGEADGSAAPRSVSPAHAGPSGSVCSRWPLSLTRTPASSIPRCRLLCREQQ